MSKLKIISVIILITVPILLVYYKVEVKNLSMIPKSSSNEWNIEVKYNIKEILEKTGKKQLNISLMPELYNQRVELLSVKPEKAIKKIELDNKILIRIEKPIKQLNINYQLKLNESFSGQVMKEKAKAYNLKKYLNTKNLTDKNYQSLKKLNHKFNFTSESNLEKIRAIYLFITEEFMTNENSNDIYESIELFEASNLIKSQVMVNLARINKIPARTMLTYIIDVHNNKEYSLKKSFVPEILLNKKWMPINVNSTTFSRIDNKQFILKHDLEESFEVNNIDSIHAAITPVMINRVDSLEYQKKIESVSSFLASISLYRLSPTMRNVFMTILLIPIGTLILALGRNIIGLKNFGTFTPILLSLFFLETSLLIGLLFFSFIVLLGFAQRYILDKFYLLAVPRLSILLTLVIISYGFVGLLSSQSNSFVYTGALNYFPIVIIAVFIERFSIHFIEEGPWNTLKALFGTLILAAACYLSFEIYQLKILLFNHPELLLIVIALHIMIGSYKGYRLSEFLRFKEFKRL